MVPSNTILNQMASLFAAYVVAQLTAPTWKVKMVSNPFVPGPNLVAGDVTIDANWLNVNTAITASMTGVGVNPVTKGILAMNFSSKTGDYSMASTPRLIYGLFIQEQTGHTPVASYAFPTPINIASNYDVVPVPPLSFELPLSAVR